MTDGFGAVAVALRHIAAPAPNTSDPSISTATGTKEYKVHPDILSTVYGP